MIGKLIKAPLAGLLSWKPFRRRVIFELRQHHYPDLEVRIPLGNDLICPLAFPEAWYSFAEVFVRGEYERAMDLMPRPARWIDLGSHAGFFSLSAILRRKQDGGGEFAALLIDGDKRAEISARAIAGCNRFGDRLHFRLGLISRAAEPQQFIVRSYVGSSLASINAEPGTASSVATISPDEIVREFPGPYDLIKVDIEGGEYDFLLGYGDVHRQARHLLIEWHQWQPGGGGREQIVQLAMAANFVEIPLPLPARSGSESNPAKTGLLLFRNRAYR